MTRRPARRWDDIIRQGSCLYAYANPSSSGWGDTIRLTATDTRGDNKMNGFAACIDCGHPWQGGGANGPYDYEGLDRAACNSNDCNHGNIRRLYGPGNSLDDCKGGYCDGTCASAHPPALVVVCGADPRHAPRARRQQGLDDLGLDLALLHPVGRPGRCSFK